MGDNAALSHFSYQPVIVLLELNPIYLWIIATLSLFRRYDMPGTNVIYWGWGFMGPSLPAGDVSGGGLFQSRLLSVPQYVWGTDTSVQCQRVRREEFIALASIHTHPRTDRESRRSARPGVFCGLHQHVRWKGPSGRGWRSTSKQAAEDELIREGGPAKESAYAQLPALWEGLQHGRSSSKAPTTQLLISTRSGESAATQVPQGRLWTHDPVYWRPLPAQPSSHAAPCSSPHAQPTALSWREARGQLATETTEDECWPLKPRQSQTTTIDSNWPLTGGDVHGNRFRDMLNFGGSGRNWRFMTICFFSLETQPLLEITVIFFVS